MTIVARATQAMAERRENLIGFGLLRFGLVCGN